MQLIISSIRWCCRTKEAYTSEKGEDLFVNKHVYLKKYLAATEKNKVSLPESHYFNLFQPKQIVIGPLLVTVTA